MDDEQAVQALLRLRDDECGPPSVDLGAAMRVGRGRLRRRRAAQFSASAVVAVAVVAAAPATLHAVRQSARPAVSVPSSVKASPSPSPSPSPGPTSLTCVETRLPVPQANQMALVSGADPTGHYMVGRVYKNSNPTQVIIWHDGQFKTLTMSGTDIGLVDITPDGVAVGSSFSYGLGSTGWIYQDGRLTKLKGPYGADPRAIADNGTIAGTESTPDAQTYPIVWHSPTSTAVRLPLPGPDWRGEVNDVDSDGTILGTVNPRTKPMATQGIVWHPDGSYQLLPIPNRIVAGATAMQVQSIRNGSIVGAGTVAGKSSKPPTPVLYRLSTGEFTPLPKANLFLGPGNDQGWIAGQSLDEKTPTLYTPTTGNVPLPTLLPTSKSARWGAISTTISDSGLIIGGEDVDAKNVIHAVRWTCH